MERVRSETEGFWYSLEILKKWRIRNLIFYLVLHLDFDIN